MSFVPGFEADIFISYTHVDNQPLTEGQRGWVDAFHRALERRLAQVLAADPEVFVDRKLQGNDVFDQRLESILRRTAFLVTIVSPRYLGSEWCMRELKIFMDAAEASGGVSIENQARIFKVIKHPLDSHDALPELENLLGYDFFIYDPDTATPREFKGEMDHPSRVRFEERICDLAHEIRKLLKTFNPDATLTKKLEAPSAPVIYLAETTRDIQEERDDVKRELKQQGYVVLPDAALPWGSSFQGAARDMLARADVSVHLFGSTYGADPEGTGRSLTHLQFELAGERVGQPGFFRIAWMPPGLDPEEERAGALVEHLRTSEEAHRGTDVLESSVEELKTQIHDTVARLRQEGGRPSDASARADDGLRVIYLICDPADQEQVRPLEDFLFERFEVVLPALEGEEEEIVADHRENLLRSDGILLYWGRGTEAWFKAQARELLKAAGYGSRVRAPRAAAAYVAPPESPAKTRFRTHAMDLIQAGPSFDPALLDEFIGAVEGSR